MKIVTARKHLQVPNEAIDAWTEYEKPDISKVGVELREAVLLRHAFMSGFLAARK